MNDKREESDRRGTKRLVEIPDPAGLANGQGTGQRGSWSRVISLTRKEVRQLLRDPGSLALGIGLPIALILIFGFGLSLDVRDAPVAVVLEDPSPTAADVIAGPGAIHLYQTDRCQFHARCRALDARARGGCYRPQVPNDFSRRLSAAGMRRCNCWCMVPRPAGPPLSAAMSAVRWLSGRSDRLIVNGGRPGILPQSVTSMNACGSMPPIPVPGTWCRGWSY